MNTASSATLQSSELLHFYPNFMEAEVPEGTSALKAWVGDIRPFSDDLSARHLLRALERDLSVSVDRGILAIETAPIETHPLEHLLVGMCIPFRVLILDLPSPQHPRAYGIAPQISWKTFPAHPHLRGDQEIAISGLVLPALCVYSSADYVYRGALPKVVEFMDQLATYLAKQLIWLRTRRLYDILTGRIVYTPPAGVIIADTETRNGDLVSGVSRHFKRVDREWRGHWPGSAAPNGPAMHVATINPDSECWCGRGSIYRECHRPDEVRMLQSMKRSK